MGFNGHRPKMLGSTELKQHYQDRKRMKKKTINIILWLKEDGILTLINNIPIT